MHVPYEKIGDYLRFIRENRLNLEIYFSAAGLDAIGGDALQRLKESLDYAPSLSFHAPFMDLCPGAVDLKIRAVTMERFNQVLDAAEILKPKCIVFHSGYEKWKYAHNVDIWLEKSLETWRPLISAAGKLGVRIAVENIFEDEPSNLKLLMETIGSGNFGICFDAGHCNLFSKVPLKAWLEELGPYILELHLHDNDKSADQHLPIGDGTIDFKTLFSEMKGRDCIYTIEAHSAEKAMRSLAALKRYTE